MCRLCCLDVQQANECSLATRLIVPITELHPKGIKEQSKLDAGDPSYQ